MMKGNTVFFNQYWASHRKKNEGLIGIRSQTCCSEDYRFGVQTKNSKI